MSASLFIKKSLSYPMCYLHKIGNIFRSDTNVLILMYHRILKDSFANGLLEDGMYVNINTFETQIQYLKNNFNIVSLETSLDAIKNNSKFESDRTLCSITFDDGWIDFFENAYSILKSHKVYATVFLPTDYIGTNNQLWTEKLASIIPSIKSSMIRENNHENSVYILNHIVKLKGSNKERYEKAIKLLKTVPSDEIDAIILELATRGEIDISSQPRSFLSWEEIKDMFESGFIQYGSHTKSHKLLTMLSDNVIHDELTQSRARLLEEGVVSKSFIPFAYPNGDHDDRVAKMVESAGYSCALTTITGWNSLTDSEVDVYKLKRVGVHQDMTSTNAMFSCRIHGLY